MGHGPWPDSWGCAPCSEIKQVVTHKELLSKETELRETKYLVLRSCVFLGLGCV